MKSKTAANALEKLVKSLARENPIRIEVVLVSDGKYEIKYFVGEEVKNVEGRLRGTVLPGPVLTNLSERAKRGYVCNEPVPLKGRVGAYRLEYAKAR